MLDRWGFEARVVPHRPPKCEGKACEAALATAFPWRTISQNIDKRNGAMTGQIETYRVEAYNTAKQSENKMHDDTVARRFGFSGGLVPGVDVMAYMMHLPVATWGRAFLERGLIDARFLKPVYDGEDVELTARESDGALELEVESRGEICATGSAQLPEAAPTFDIADYREVAPVAERHPVSSASFELGSWLGTTPRAWAGDVAN